MAQASRLPLPSHIHYELLLQLLERQTARNISREQPQKEQLQNLIVTLRKAFSQQKQLEESCVRSQIPIEYHWSLNNMDNGVSYSKALPKNHPNGSKVL
ncbi:MAG: hypothetical protein DCF25_17975 [Leptolyngbya foveolarum]|uniref:DUF5340 domain-containing protein n=1 Tax=Leptolyngbya foveolarum TaxID=47253 RepID=A0A2W4TZ86_9CYAN|nr:MAG: hypothetical protein DCF25_17975 [Leptolyngbya foveolarum]